jgi:hypothetical protein
MKKRTLAQLLVWLSLMLAANALAQGRGGSHIVTGHAVGVGFSRGHYAYVGGFHGSFYWGFGFGFSLGWPYYAWPYYHYYVDPVYPYYRYYGYPYYPYYGSAYCPYYGYSYCWGPSGPYVSTSVPPARGLPSRPTGSNAPPPTESNHSQPPTSNSAPYANADGQWHKLGETDPTPYPQRDTVLASVRTNELAPVLRSHGSDGEWHRFRENK